MNKEDIIQFWSLPNMQILTHKMNEILVVVDDNYNENQILDALHVKGLDVGLAIDYLFQTNEQQSKANDTHYNIKQQQNQNQKQNDIQSKLNTNEPKTICEHETDDSDNDLPSPNDKYNKNKNYNHQFVSTDWQNIELPSFQKHFYRESERISPMNDVDVITWRKERDIVVIGDKIPRPIRTFVEAGFPSYIMTEIITPTPLHSQIWPVILSGRDVICITETVTDNVLAFVLPGIVHINAQPLLRPGDGPIALVIVAARETALQIEKESSKFTYSSKIKHICLCGGTPKKDQIRNLRIGAEILICTPPKLLEYLESSHTNLTRVTYLAIVEADKLLENGYAQQIQLILSQIRPDRQILIFCGLWSRQLREFTFTYCISDGEIQISIGNSRHEKKVILPNADFDIEMVNNTEHNNSNKNIKSQDDKHERDDFDEEKGNDNEEQVNNNGKKYKKKEQSIANKIAAIIRTEVKDSNFISYLDNGQDMLLISKTFDFISEMNKKMINKTFKHSGNQQYTPEEKNVFREHYDDTEANTMSSKPIQQRLRFALIATCPDHEILRNAKAVGTGYERWVKKQLLKYEKELASFIVNDEETLDDDDDDEKENKLNESISHKLNKGDYVSLDEIFEMVGKPQQLEGMDEIEPKCRPSKSDFKNFSNVMDINEMMKEKNDISDFDRCGDNNNVDDDGDQPMNN